MHWRDRHSVRDLLRTLKRATFHKGHGTWSLSWVDNTHTIVKIQVKQSTSKVPVHGSLWKYVPTWLHFAFLGITFCFQLQNLNIYIYFLPTPAETSILFFFLLVYKIYTSSCIDLYIVPALPHTALFICIRVYSCLHWVTCMLNMDYPCLFISLSRNKDFVTETYVTDIVA